MPAVGQIINTNPFAKSLKQTGVGNGRTVDDHSPIGVRKLRITQLQHNDERKEEELISSYPSRTNSTTPTFPKRHFVVGGNTMGAERRPAAVGVGVNTANDGYTHDRRPTLKAIAFRMQDPNFGCETLYKCSCFSSQEAIACREIFIRCFSMRVGSTASSQNCSNICKDGQLSQSSRQKARNKLDMGPTTL
jgi:hypothetical protein